MEPDKDMGYGQSILHKDSLVFDLPNPLSRSLSAKRGKLTLSMGRVSSERSVTVGCFSPDIFVNEEDDDSETPLIPDQPDFPSGLSPSPSFNSPSLLRKRKQKAFHENSDSDAKSAKSVKFLNSPGTVILDVFRKKESLAFSCLCDIVA